MTIFTIIFTIIFTNSFAGLKDRSVFPMAAQDCRDSTLLTQTSAQNLNVSTIAVQNGSSVLECWSLQSPTTGAGASNYPLGNFTNAFIGAIPPHTYIGAAWPKSIQYFLPSAFPARFH
ncbi:hypothetical protein D6D24_05729 [Aureobasidium pullulans]|uniref:Carboxylic ester hydrolase n=1 Tax=Aureobasidium pullulans TaxID=5580 RepID=A0A4S8VP76_AURPU|nr:hypothetical protein D6D24_05729 [Aureobasidium pullulans]